VFDVIIVGAGPSGSTVSYLLAKEGLRVALVEKFKLPRFKACGGGLTLKTVSLLRDLDLYSKDVILSTCSVLKVFYKGDYLFDVENANIFITRRDFFDYHLANRAVEEGARLIEGTSVTGIKETSSGVKVFTGKNVTLPARVVVGADGVYSIVARSLGKRWRREDLSISAISLLSLEDFGGNACGLYFGVVDYGYGWAFPVESSGCLFNVGCGTPLKYSKSLLRAFRRFTRYLGASQHEVYVHLLPTPPKFRRGSFGRGRILLVGDAAGLVDPWLGEGIYYAVKSAFHASRAVLDNLDEGTVIGAYQQLLEEDILPDLKYAYIFRRIFYSKMPEILGLIGRFNRLRRAFTKLLNGELRYRDLAKYLSPRWRNLLHLKDGLKFQALL